MLVVVAIFVLGGEVLNTFALTLIIGIITGTYSSIYVASPVVVIWKDFAERRRGKRVPVKVVPPPAEPALPKAAPESAEAAPRQKKKKNRR